MNMTILYIYSIYECVFGQKAYAFLLDSFLRYLMFNRNISDKIFFVFNCQLLVLLYNTIDFGIWHCIMHLVKIHLIKYL